MRRLSRHDALIRDVRALDGVVTVDDDGLKWVEDDTTPRYYSRPW